MATATVSSLAALSTALAAAQGGDTIRVEPGNYGSLNVKRGQAKDFPLPVTIEAAVPEEPPVFAPMTLYDLSNVRFRDLAWEQLDDLGARHTGCVTLYGGKKIEFLQNKFRGHARQGQHGRFGYGIVAEGVEGLAVAKNEFSNLERGFVGSKGRLWLAELNHFHDIGHDCMSFAELRDSAIRKNLMEDFHPGPDYHPDGIQFHCNGTKGSHNIVIAQNLIICDPERRAQGIFMRGGYKGDVPDQRYSGILIEENTTAGTMWNGIMVTYADRLNINRNRILHLPGKDRMIARIVTDYSTGAAIDNESRQFLLNKELLDKSSGNRVVEDVTPGEVAEIRRQWMERFMPAPRPLPVPPPPPPADGDGPQVVNLELKAGDRVNIIVR